MAHLRSLTVKCYEGGCERRATVELLSNRNESHGMFCVRHGQQRELRLQQAEDTARASRLGGL